ncbi:SMI1/KNR4 family protein [Peribacillus cavernae]|uniref:SMI1/KNR4 family protein n=1 Tax=Peribacillus cavernae TaxID=1674310 RepID=UPI0011781561|nr:SMI1/KNR4 family protein [Peribacillus cavernae]MDQ0221350.1 hypothetical protein [Peribacillus cavernae]
MEYLTVEKFIDKYEEDGDFTGGINEEKIKLIEEQLYVQLPESYKSVWTAL